MPQPADVRLVTEAALEARLVDYVPATVLTQAQYDALATKDPNTLYLITGA